MASVKWKRWSHLGGCALSLVAILAGASKAEAFRDWNDFAQWCVGQGGRPVKAGPGHGPQCFPAGRPVDPYAQRVGRYRDVLDGAGDMVDSDLDRNPQTEDELRELLETLSDRLYRRLNADEERSESDRAWLDALSVELSKVERATSRDYSYKEDLEAKRTAAESAAAQASRDLDAATGAAVSLEIAAVKAEGRWWKARRDVIEMLALVVPRSRDFDRLHSAYDTIVGFTVPDRPPLALAAEPAYAVGSWFKARFYKPDHLGYAGQAAPRLTGSVDDRLTTIERLVATVREGASDRAAVHERLQAKIERYESYREIDERLEADNVALEKAIDTASRTRLTAEYKLEEVRDGIARSAKAVFAFSAGEFALSNFKTYVVIPELTRMINEAYGLVKAPSQATLEQMVASTYQGKTKYDQFEKFTWDGVDARQDRAGRRLHLFPLIRTLEKGKQVKALLQRTWNLVAAAEQGADDAARLLATGTPGAGQELADRMFDELDANAKAEAKQALKVANIGPPYREFWLKYFVNE